MRPLEFLVEPESLLVTWQAVDERAEDRTRRVVATVERSSDGEGAVFRYAVGTGDFEAARSAGFKGLPSFSLSEVETTGPAVIESLMRRLPPRKREDFIEFLSRHRLPARFELSDLALLAYTGAKLPSDGISFVPVFPRNAACLDLLVEVAGLRHVFTGDPSSIRTGDAVTFSGCPNNMFDPDAVGVFWRGMHLGYVNRAMRSQFNDWMASGALTAEVERINGKPERPLVYLRVKVRKQGGERTAVPSGDSLCCAL